MSQPSTQKKNPPEHVEVFFDLRDGSYWYRLNGRFVQLKRSDLQLHFRTMGLRDDNYFDGLREIDWPLWQAQIHRMIDYAGSLAGHRVSIFQDGSNRKFMVTDEPNGVWETIPRKTEQPEFFVEFVQELLPEDQWQHFCYWLAIALRSLRRGDFRPGQTVVFAGPAGCGKSLLQDCVTEVLGGRSANPFRYMMGLTQFNKDLVGAEHWKIEDPPTTTDIRTRRQFGAMLKDATVNRDLSIHQKGKDALSLPIFRRVTISVNDEPENLAVVPPLDPSIQDKVFLFHCAVVREAFQRFRLDDRTPALPGMGDSLQEGDLDRAKLWAHVKAEVPLVRAWLMKSFRKVPLDLRDDRFGIVAWHHPQLLSELTALAPETRLLQLVDEVCFEKAEPGVWTGKAIDLEKQLRGSNFAFECEKVLRFFGACGSYLGKLARNQPDRVTRRVKDGYTSWMITPPPSYTKYNHEQDDNDDPEQETSQDDPKRRGKR